MLIFQLERPMWTFPSMSVLAAGFHNVGRHHSQALLSPNFPCLLARLWQYQSGGTELFASTTLSARLSGECFSFLSQVEEVSWALWACTCMKSWLYSTAWVGRNTANQPVKQPRTDWQIVKMINKKIFSLFITHRQDVSWTAGFSSIPNHSPTHCAHATELSFQFLQLISIIYPLYIMNVHMQFHFKNIEKYNPDVTVYTVELNFF